MENTDLDPNLDIESDRQIDPDQLDVEWLDQVNLFYKYSTALDDASQERNAQKLEVEDLEEQLKNKKAEIELAVREDPDAYGVDKVTESSIKAGVLTSEEYETALKEVREAKVVLNDLSNKVNRLFTFMNTIKEKKDAMQELVKLLNQQYFATPSVPRNLTDEFKKHNEKKQTQKQAREKIKNQKRKRK